MRLVDYGFTAQRLAREAKLTLFFQLVVLPHYDRYFSINVPAGC